MGKPRILQTMGPCVGRFLDREGAFPGSPESSDAVFAGSAESVSLLAAITRVRSADPDALLDLSPDCR